jgi:hypothetical protein
MAMDIHQLQNVTISYSRYLHMGILCRIGLLELLEAMAHDVAQAIWMRPKQLFLL